MCSAAPARAGAPQGGIDLFELHPGPGPDHLVIESVWEAGAGVEHFALRADGGSETRTAFDNVQLQALWMPQANDRVTLALGVRHDLRQGGDLSHGVLGIEASVLSWLDAEHYFFVSQRGDLTGSGQVTVNVPLGDKWRIEPRVAVNWAARAVPLEGLAGGMTDMNASARLRRSLGDHADLYVGIVHERLLNGTATIARQSDSVTHVTRGVVGFGFAL